jgi:ATP-dependent DNA helicase RecG
MIESWGRGIEKITEACKNAGNPAPVIEYKYNREFSVTFFNDVSIVENIVDNVVVNATQAKILELMRSNPKTTAKAIATTVGIAPRNVQVHIQTLKDLGLVERVGAAKGGYWVVK